MGAPPRSRHMASKTRTFFRSLLAELLPGWIIRARQGFRYRRAQDMAGRSGTIGPNHRSVHDRRRSSGR